MRRVNLTLAAVLILVGGSVAADSQSGKIAIGAKAGLNVSDIVSDGIDSSPRLGIVAGVFATVPFGKLSVQPEVLYSMKGYDADKLDFTVELDYIEFPVLIRYDFRPRNGHVMIGPAISRRLNAKNSLGDDLKSWTAKTVFCIVGGGGFAFETSSGILGVEGRVTIGLSDTFDEDHAQVVCGERNINFSLMAAWSFDL